MNDMTEFGGGGDRDRQICDLRIRGFKTEREVCEMLGVTTADVHRALDRGAQASMTPQSRVRDIYVMASRLEIYEESLGPEAAKGDVQTILAAVKVQERRATLLGSNAPLRVDPIELAEIASPKLTTTQEMERILDEIQAKQRAREGSAQAGGEVEKAGGEGG